MSLTALPTLLAGAAIPLARQAVDIASDGLETGFERGGRAFAELLGFSPGEATDRTTETESAAASSDEVRQWQEQLAQVVEILKSRLEALQRMTGVGSFELRTDESGQPLADGAGAQRSDIESLLSVDREFQSAFSELYSLLTNAPRTEFAALPDRLTIQSPAAFHEVRDGHESARQSDLTILVDRESLTARLDT